ncbi:hypothetical protein BH10PSE3_BH10PSE3_18530 [soil metagenome]
MGISKTEAASALTDIESMAGRSRLFRGYHVAGPILMVWGVIWALGYSGMGLLPSEQWGLIWLPLDAIGIVASIVLGRRGKGRAGAAPAWKMWAGALTIVAFMTATYAVFQPTSTDTLIVFPGMIAGLIYAGFGIVSAPRYLWIGTAVFIASLVGFYFFQPYLAFWMAAAGGGGLFVSGLWLRGA